MTYIEAVTIEQKFMVRLEFAEAIGREKLEIVEDVAAGFTKEQLAEALIVLKNKKTRRNESADRPVCVGDKEQAMKLQKMIYERDGDIFTFFCAVNLYCNGGEYTICGNAIPDSTIESCDCEKTGDEFEGKLKDVTCPNCLNFINFIKGFK